MRFFHRHHQRILGFPIQQQFIYLHLWALSKCVIGCAYLCFCVSHWLFILHPPLMFTADKFDAGMHPMPALTQQNHSTEFPSQSLKKRGDKRENLIQLTIWRKSRFAIRILQHALKLDVHSALQQSALPETEFSLGRKQYSFGNSTMPLSSSPARHQPLSSKL